MGGRALRVNILSPITGTYFGLNCFFLAVDSWFIDHQAIDARLDVVAGGFSHCQAIHKFTRVILEFIQREDRFNDTREALKLMNKMDFDKLIVSV
jgi:DNA mismatch repair protein MSH4